MLSSIHELQTMCPIEDLIKTGFAMHPIHADETSSGLLDKYHTETSLDVRDDIEKYLISINCFQGNTDACNSYLGRRKELLERITKIQKALLEDVKKDLENDLHQLENDLVVLDNETACSLWMTDSEMQVHRDIEGRGFAIPPVWNCLVSLVRKEYCRFSEKLYISIQCRARTIGDCDELRFDMLRYAIFLLKYYGFRSENELVHLEGKEGNFFFGLENPTWKDLEDAIRSNLKKINLEGDLPTYPDTPTVAPSPLKDDESSELAIFIASMCNTIGRSNDEIYQKKPFF